MAPGSSNSKEGKGKPKKPAKAKKGPKTASPTPRSEHRAARVDTELGAELLDDSYEDAFAEARETSPGATEALQVAALHAIAAAKAFLDVAERVVQDPQLAGHTLVAVRTVGKGVLGSLAGFGGHDGDADDPPLEHIDVS